MVYSKLQDVNGNVMYRDGKPLIHTDGTGFISEDLALECPMNVFKGQAKHDAGLKVCDFMLINIRGKNIRIYNA